MKTWSVDKIMAYINCAKCPAQSFPTGESVCNGYLEEFQCVSKHKTYIDKEDVDGNTRAAVDDGSTDRTGTCA